MAASKEPRRLYLKLRGAQWFLNYPIPTELRSLYLTAAGKPRDHIVMATGTADLNEADRRKHGMIHRLQVEFSRKQREAAGALPADLLTAKEFAKELEEASKADNFELADTLQMKITDEAEKIHEKGGMTAQSLERARVFVSIATGAQPLMECFEDWMDNSSLPQRTRLKYRTAVQEFAEFLGGLPLASHVTSGNALRYVDWLNKEARSQRTKKLIPLSYNTKRDRVMALSAFWNLWLKPRRLAIEAVNPFSKLRVTDKPTPSSIKWDSTENAGRGRRRGYFDEAELLAILDAPGPSQDRLVKYPKALLLELFSLMLLTGARPSELCSLTPADVKERDGGLWLNLDETKTKDDRQIPLVHPVAVKLLKRRLESRKGHRGPLFPEFPKSAGDDPYKLVGKALGRHFDRAEGLDVGDVPYMARHTFLTIVGNIDGVNDHALKRYAGHRPEGMTDERYRGVPPEALLSIAKKVKMPKAVEARMRQELGLR